MATIESYNASYPLSYYQIGNVYSFYGTKNAKMAEPATDEQRPSQILCKPPKQGVK